VRVLVRSISASSLLVSACGLAFFCGEHACTHLLQASIYQSDDGLLLGWCGQETANHSFITIRF